MLMKLFITNLEMKLVLISLFVCKLWSQVVLSVTYMRGKFMIGREHLISSQVKQSSYSLSSALSPRSVSCRLHTDVNVGS